MMNFLKTIRDSIYSPSFYATIPQKPFRSALGYFLLLSLFLTFIQAIIPIWNFATVGQEESTTFINQVADIYPSELEITIRNGAVSTNVEEPYFIALPNDGNLVVIDTKTPFSATQFRQYDSIAWIAKDSLFIRENNGAQIRTIDLSQVSNFTVDKPFVNSLIGQISPWLKFVAPLAVIGILLGFYALHAGRLLYLPFLALLIFLLAKLMKKSLPYGASYKVGLYAVTLGFFVELVLGLVYFPGFPFMFTLISLAVVLLNFLPVRKEVPV